MKVKQFRFGGDNLAYLAYTQNKAVAVDGGAWEEILSFIGHHQLELAFVVNTHSHFDHTPGNEYLLLKTKASFLDFQNLPDNHTILLEQEKLTVFHTPGHSVDSVCFYTGSALMSGDTLFNGTIGNCFTGDLRGFYGSIKRLMALPDETVIYAGHDYVRDSLAYARHLEPQNSDIEHFARTYDPRHVYSTLAVEKKINPFLRFNETPIVEFLAQRGLPRATEWERWESLMSIE